jgi:hypothetical protein
LPRGQPIVCIRNRRPWYNQTRGFTTTVRTNPGVRLSLPQRPAPPQGVQLVLPIHPMRGIAGPGRGPVRLSVYIGPGLPPPARPLFLRLRQPAVTVPQRYAFGLVRSVPQRQDSRALTVWPPPTWPQVKNQPPPAANPRRALYLRAALDTTFSLPAAAATALNLRASRATTFNLPAGA